jgi:hypothetical protein
VDIDTRAVADLTPLVNDTFFGSGDNLYAAGDTAIDCTAQAANIAALKARGVNVTTPCL